MSTASGQALRSLLRCGVFCVLALPWFARRLSAQAAAVDYGARLKHKPLLLRGFWRPDKLEFDRVGQPVQTYVTEPFTQCGIDVESVAFSHDALEIHGRRVGLAFDSKGNISRLPAGDMRIRISGEEGDDFAPALDKIFAPDLASVVPSLPDSWQLYARVHFLPQVSSGVGAEGKSTPAATNIPKSPSTKDPTVEPPRLLRSTNPKPSPMASELKHSGSVVIAFVVNENGNPESLNIARPAGLGLDEQALAAVASYRFSPAKKNGLPVPIKLIVDVDFSSF